MKKHSCNKKFNSNIVTKCVHCIYFPQHTLLESDYRVDTNGVKRSDVHIKCLYDLHDITPQSTCPKGK